jgi:hypothetical protein
MVGAEEPKSSYAVAAEANTESSCFVNARANRRTIGNTSPADKVGDFRGLG